MNEILNSTQADINTIFKFYDIAIAYQKIKFNKHWLGFDKEMIEREINEKRQFKILVDGEVACIFAITFNDVAIWGDKNSAPSVYLHRIVTDNAFRGKNFVKVIIEWAVEYCIKNQKQFVRMDTWGDNQRLIGYYQSCGFTFLGLTGEMNAANLPKHYDSISLSLFEIAVADYKLAKV